MTLFGNGLKTKPTISSPYGPRTGGAYSFHYGTDYTGYNGIHAVEKGTVGTVSRNATAGNYVSYDLDWKGPKGETITIVHMHIADGSINVKPGQRISEGQQFALMGQTGNATGKCDHIEVRYWLNGKYTNLDPDPWLTARVLGGATAGTGSTTDLFGVTYAKVAQTFLKALGIYDGLIDGIFGPKSVAATKTFQGWVNLKQDGIFGPDTNKAASVIKAGAKLVARPTLDIHKFLQGKGLYTGPLDNTWRVWSSMSTYRYQRSVGLSADGQWGQYTDAKAFPVVVTPPPVVTPPVPPVTGVTGSNITQRPNSEIQSSLKAKGLYSGDVDGVYGPGTTAAVVKLQNQGGLVADGIYGANTDVYLYKRAAFLKTAKQGVTVTGGTTVAGRKITGLNVHHYGSTGDDRAYFANPMNTRKSCPTITILATGEAFEYIAPHLQPWSTGANDANRVSVELQNSTTEPDWQISAKATETLINLMVELRMATINKTLIDGMVVDFVLDRAHIQGDQEFRATTCPGPYVMSHLAEWIATAQKRVDALTAPVTPPVTPPATDPKQPIYDALDGVKAMVKAL